MRYQIDGPIAYVDATAWTGTIIAPDFKKAAGRSETGRAFCFLKETGFFEVQQYAFPGAISSDTGDRLRSDDCVQIIQSNMEKRPFRCPGFERAFSSRTRGALSGDSKTGFKKPNGAALAAGLKGTELTTHELIGGGTQ
jgi:hypothetical protein